MPEMDGFQFIAQLFENERLARIPVVVASANDHSEELMRRFGRPFPICSFPFSPEKIAEIFREHRL
jgi:CheY-like chemotaxis protein